jgi:hypothetical protein
MTQQVTIAYTSCRGMVWEIRSVFEGQPDLHPIYLGLKDTFLLPRLH